MTYPSEAIEQKYWFVSWAGGMRPEQGVMDTDPLQNQEFISGRRKLNYHCQIDKVTYDMWLGLKT